MIIQCLPIFVGRSGIQAKAEVVQKDSGRKLKCQIMDMTIAEGCTARIYGRKPSGLEIYNDCTLNGNAVIVELTTQFLAEIGTVPAQVELTKEGNTVTSFEFLIVVKRSLVNGGAIESSNEFTALKKALNDAYTAAYQAVSEYIEANGLEIDVPDEQIKEAVDKYLAENPVTGISKIYMRVSGGYIQYSSDNSTWKNLLAMDDINGSDGADGKDGKDGISPTISTSTITGGHRITLKDVNGTKTVDVMDGKDGEQGEQGIPGEKGDTGASGKDGKDGSDASVTAENIQNALGYTPANKDTVDQLSNEIDDHIAIFNRMLSTGGEIKKHYSPSSITTGKYISIYGSEVTSADTTIGYTEKITVKVGDIIRVVVTSTSTGGADKYINPIVVCAYQNGVVVSSLGLNNVSESVTEYVVPNGVNEIIVSAYFKKTGYNNPRIEIISNKIEESEVLVNYGTIRNDYAWSMPKKVFAKVGENVKLYLRNLNTMNYPVMWGQYLSNATIYNYDDYIEIVPTATGSKNVAYKVYDEHLNLVEEGTTNLVISNLAPSSQTMLLIGDSTIASGDIATKLIDLFSADGNTATLLGTQGSGNAKHEGYSGKKLSDFANGFSGSPFGESGFNFSSYMSSKGYSGVNTVVIQGGINDTNNLAVNADLSSIITALDTIVNSILAYNSNIKILVDLVTMPTSISENFAIKYGTANCNWIARHNAQRLNKLIIEHYASKASVTCVATNAILDTTEDITDNVHPTSDGYVKLANQIYYTLMGL